MDDSSEDQKGWSVYDSIKGSTNQSSIHSDGDAHEDLSIKGIQVGRCPSDPEGLDEARSFNEAHRDRDAIKIQQDAGLCLSYQNPGLCLCHQNPTGRRSVPIVCRGLII
jgi:hypothetical protein